MSLFVEAVDGFGRTQPDKVAFFNSAGERLTYGELARWSDALAAELAGREGSPAGRPIAVYGHKSPFMPVSFLACVKSGHPYVPLDSSLPAERIQAILGQLDRPLLLDAHGAFPEELAEQVGARFAVDEGLFESLRAVPAASAVEAPAAPLAPAAPAGELPADRCVAGDDTFYILFTSGSTGVPKGVQVSAANVDAFLVWMREAFSPGVPQVFFDRAPFSFDLSVTDLIRGLGAGDALFALEREAESSLKRAFEALAASGTTFWVSTPSFADMCLADPAFGRDLMPDLRTFFFVGETLRNETAAQLLERFPGCEVVNGYGPTESTDLVTATRITPAMAALEEPLPVGMPRPGTQLHVLDPETLKPVPAGTPGELFIVGDTVAKGYFNLPEATAAAFASYPGDVPAGMRSYRTGDRCFVDATGMLHFCGRFDFQVKLHGYRIELGDIESNLCALGEVRQACVIPVEKNGAISYLRAFVQPEAGVEGTFQTTRLLKAALAQRLPDYMVPRAFAYVDGFPVNANGKIDRSELARRAQNG